MLYSLAGKSFKCLTVRGGASFPLGSANALQHSMRCYATLPSALAHATTAGGGAQGTLQIFANAEAAAPTIALHAAVGCESHTLQGHRAISAWVPGLARPQSPSGDLSLEAGLVGVLAKGDTNGDINAFCCSVSLPCRAGRTRL
jgi:hypothetical protein